MSQINELRVLLDLLAHGDPDEYFIDSVWEQEIKCFCADLEAGLAFILNDCTDEEFYFLAEIFDDIIAQTQSEEFLRAIRDRAEQVENPRHKAAIIADIDFAAGFLNMSTES